MTSQKDNNKKNRIISSELLIKQEMQNLESLSLAYLIFFICANIGFWVGEIFEIASIPGFQFFLIIISIVLSLFLICSVLFLKRKILIIKFIIFPTAIVLILFGILASHNIWLFFAYFPVLAMIGLFNDWKFSATMGTICIACFLALFAVTDYFSTLSFIIWFTYLVLVSIIVIFITKRNYDFLIDFSKMSQDAEDAKMVLEIKVKARTGELEELAEGLEKKVSERTKELKNKIDEMEKFQKFTIGRELKMMELKKELKQLKK
jgi:signal transduction histidine kinase